MEKAKNVIDVDFTKHENAMVKRFNHPEELRDTGFRHLKAILSDAQKHQPCRYYALPYAADQAMHVLLLDNLFVHRISEQLFGDDHLIAHDPFPPEGPQRVTAWDNTRAALAAAGIEMPTYDEAVSAKDAGPFTPEGCWLWVEPLAA
ncbi:hypothetical protein [Azospirillum cavernae]|uniref:hypothetical protein n=1 Tax=Azospirillum cavernae TaxID=2320860 RepID=UPI0011C46C84|nr:hypothetical protein [Azospirillum cavernae]